MYSSHIIEWRKAARTGAAVGLGPAGRDRRDKEIEQLRARAEKAESELARSRAAPDLIGKALLGRSRASHYRARKEAARRSGLPFGPDPRHEQPPRPTPPNALSDAERQRVLGVLTEPRFADKAVAQTWAVPLDEGTTTGPR